MISNVISFPVYIDSIFEENLFYCLFVFEGRYGIVWEKLNFGLTICKLILQNFLNMLRLETIKKINILN